MRFEDYDRVGHLSEVKAGEEAEEAERMKAKKSGRAAHAAAAAKTENVPIINPNELVQAYGQSEFALEA